MAVGDGSAANLVIGGVPLDEGQYRFTASVALTDDFDNLLDGDGDGTSGDPYQRMFYVGYPMVCSRPNDPPLLPPQGEVDVVYACLVAGHQAPTGGEVAGDCREGR